jgi:hypothetical protein
MAEITVTIPNDRVAEALEGFLVLYPNGEMTENTEEVEDFVPVLKYTDAQWVRQIVKRNLVRDIYRGLNMKAQKLARQVQDETIVE